MFSDFTNSKRPVLPFRSAVESNRFGINVDRLNIPQRSEFTDKQAADLFRFSDADPTVPFIIYIIEEYDLLLSQAQFCSLNLGSE